MALRRILLCLPLLLPMPMWGQQRQASFTAAWWNVENYFDTRDDPLTRDDDFTPDGAYHWTRRHFNAKRDGLYRTILMMDLPDVVGLAEVENDYVLRELCMATPLRQASYSYVHYDSPDRRGIDCALLYRRDRFRPLHSRPINVSDSAARYFTRDILLVCGVTPQVDTLYLLLNHWPSKRGGAQAEHHRRRIARLLRQVMDSLHAASPSALVLAMGDFNATPSEPVLTRDFGLGDSSRTAGGIADLVSRLPQSLGTYKYQGQWDYLDHLLLLADPARVAAEVTLVQFDHLLIDEKRLPGRRPRRTHLGPRYEAGLSDHLPLLVKLTITAAVPPLEEDMSSTRQ